MKRILHVIDIFYCKYSDWITEYSNQVDWRAGSFDNFVGHYMRGEVSFIEGFRKLIEGDF